MKDKKDKVYDSPPSQPDDGFWLDQGREMVKSSISTLTDTSKTMLMGLNILKGIYAGIIGFTAYIPENLEIPLKSLFFLPFIFWVSALFFYLQVSFTKKYTLHLLSPEDVREKYVSICKDKQRSLTIGYCLQGAGIVAFFILFIIRNFL